MNLPKSARRFVKARPNRVFLYPDMNAIEARAVAVLSKDKNLLSAFLEPIDWPDSPKHGLLDCHTRTVQLMLEAGTEISRDQSKVLIYGGFYGGQAKQLATEMNANALRKGQPNRVTTDQVQHMLDIMLKQVYSGVDRWRVNVADEVLRTRRLRCPLTGREREWLGYIYDKNTKGLKHEIAKQAWSFLPQHLAAWVLADGLCGMYYDSGHWGELLQPLIHVHDALLIEVQESRLDEAKAVVQSLMTRELWGMKFESEMKIGNNWEQCS
jgi:DNA polymerase I-like protein with 3'-5' exonuclease and polymerase domains